MSDDNKAGGFWQAVDAKFLIVTLTGIGALLGPVSQLVEGQYKLKLDALQAEHKLRLDFVERLVRAQELKEPSARVLARLDVLQLMRGTLATDDGMKAFVGAELVRTQQQYEALIALQQARADVPSAAPAPGSQPEPSPPPVVKEAIAKVKSAERAVSSRLLLTVPETPTFSSTLAPRVALAACKRYSATATGSSAPTAQLEEACRASDSGGEQWLAGVGAIRVRCECAAR